jgi:hypothetical protein
MKSNPLRTFLEWTLITSLLMSVVFFVWFYVASRGVRICQSQISVGQSRYQNNHAVIGFLLGECQEYAKTNPDMMRLLESLKVKPPAPAAPAAASKPGAK